MFRLKHPKPLIDVDPDLVFRFGKFVERDSDGCWNWNGYTDRKGYGQFKMAGRAHWAHRVAYVLFVGPIPDGFQVDHTCCNTSCVNPHHLELVTLEENVRRQHERPRS